MLGEVHDNVDGADTLWTVEDTFHISDFPIERRFLALKPLDHVNGLIDVLQDAGLIHLVTGWADFCKRVIDLTKEVEPLLVELLTQALCCAVKFTFKAEHVQRTL